MSGTNHPWCRDVRRDEAVRAAEDAAAAERTPLPDHRDLPQAVADLRERVARLTTKHNALADLARLDAGWVKTKEDCLAAERDAAIRERDAALYRLDGAMRGCVRLNNDRAAVRARVAELKAAVAPAANAGGEAKQEPVLHGVLWADRARIESHDVRDTCEQAARLAGTDGTVVPLYAAPPEPRGWLTAEERRLIEMEAKAQRDPFDITGTSRRNAAVFRSLLARESPPKVRRPMPWHFHAVESEDEENQTARDRQWEEEIRAAGGEVEE